MENRVTVTEAITGSGTEYHHGTARVLGPVGDIYGSERPVWSHGCIVIEEDDGSLGGPYGYECNRLERDGEPIGWVYDDGTGPQWSEDVPPEPYDPDPTFSPLRNAPNA